LVRLLAEHWVESWYDMSVCRLCLSVTHVLWSNGTSYRKPNWKSK